MVEVVRLEERGTEPSGVPKAGERLGKRRAVLHGLEEGLTVLCSRDCQLNGVNGPTR